MVSDLEEMTGYEQAQIVFEIGVQDRSHRAREKARELLPKWGLETPQHHALTRIESNKFNYDDFFRLAEDSLIESLREMRSSARDMQKNLSYYCEGTSGTYQVHGGEEETTYTDTMRAVENTYQAVLDDLQDPEMAVGALDPGEEVDHAQHLKNMLTAYTLVHDVRNELVEDYSWYSLNTLYNTARPLASFYMQHFEVDMIELVDGGYTDSPVPVIDNGSVSTGTFGPDVLERLKEPPEEPSADRN